jgi:hypothetical protein
VSPVPTVFTVSTADWPRFRFAHSALFETLQAVRTLGHRRQQQFHQRWLDTVDRVEVLARIPTLAALTPGIGPVWVPDFLAPAPTRNEVTAIDEELDQVIGYPPRLVRADLQRSLDSQPTPARRRVLEPLINDPTGARRRLVAELRIAWAELAQPYWPAITRLINDDIAYRSHRLARHGLGRLLEDLHDDVTVDPDRVTVRNTEQSVVPLAGQGLLLIPSAFLWPQVLAIHDRPWPPALVYPARGVGNLWAPAAVPPSALAELIGRRRSALLLDLDEPRTTTAASIRHGINPATTSAHLARLRAAGLVESRRSGKEVLYRRTSLGSALIDGSTSGDGP